GLPRARLSRPVRAAAARRSRLAHQPAARHQPRRGAGDVRFGGRVAHPGKAGNRGPRRSTGRELDHRRLGVPGAARLVRIPLHRRQVAPARSHVRRGARLPAVATVRPAGRGAAVRVPVPRFPAAHGDRPRLLGLGPRPQPGPRGPQLALRRQSHLPLVPALGGAAGSGTLRAREQRHRAGRPADHPLPVRGLHPMSAGRLAVLVMALLPLAATSSLHAAGPDPAPSPGHPPSLSPDLGYVDRGSAAYQRFRGWVAQAVAGDPGYAFAPADAAWMYRSGGGERNCRLAVELADGQVREAEAVIARGERPPISGDSYLYAGPMLEDLAMALASCPARVDAARRTRW